MDQIFYEMHRSEAIKVLLAKRKNPHHSTNLHLAELLEDSFPDKSRLYLVKEDNIPLQGNILTAETF